MATILFTYELGSGLGHLNRLIAVARELAEGNRLVFAVPDLSIATPALQRAFGPLVTVGQGVAWAPPGQDGVRMIPTHSFADVLELFGFGEAALVTSKAEACARLLAAVRPDLIVADFAPTLRMAVGDAVPIVVVGNGYTVPPPGRPLPPMRPWQPDVPAGSLRAERNILATVNTIRAGLGRGELAFLSGLFSGRRTFVCTVPEFDPYARHRTEPTTWPFNIPVIAPGPAREQRDGPGIFAYMPASHPLLEVMLAALNGVEVRTHLYVSEADPNAIAARCKPQIGVLTKPADFARLLPRTRLLIHHAGLGTAYAGLAAGTPQLLLPVNLEHLITARGLIAAGVAQGFSANLAPSADDLRATMLAMLDEPVWMRNAAAAAARVAAARDTDPLRPILAACHDLLAGDPTRSAPAWPQ